MKKTIVINGLVRKPEMLEQTVNDIKRVFAGRVPQVIFSTWTGELERYPDSLDLLRSIDALIVERPVTRFVFHGHAFHQTMTMDFALSLIDDGVLILKVRPDMHFPGLVEAFSNYQPCTIQSGVMSGAAPTQRFAIFHLTPSIPFMWVDMAFIAPASRMRMMTRPPMNFSVNLERLAAEQWIWFPCFAAQAPAVEAYFRVQPGLLFGDEARFDAVKQIYVESELYIAALASNILAVYENCDFLGLDAERVIGDGVYSQNSLEDLLWKDVSLPGISYASVCFLNSFKCRAPIEAIVAGQYVPTVFGERVAAAIKQLRAGNIGKRDQLQQQAMEFGDRLEREAFYPLSKAIRSGPSSRTILQEEPICKVKM